MLLKTFFLVLCAHFALTVHAATIPERVLRFNYKIECEHGDDQSIPGIVGEVKVGNRRLRVVLFRYKQIEEASLGRPTDDDLAALAVRWFPNPSCHFVYMSHTPDLLSASGGIADLALKHSPYLILRPDQVARVDRDVPMHLAYSVAPQDGAAFAIRYTMTFSNESDYSVFATSKSKSMRQYGRRTDIEWVYEVIFDAHQNVKKRRFQSGIKFGIGHATWIFNGQYLKGTSHPVLFNIAKHNVFSAIAYPGQTLKTPAFHLVPREELQKPEAREDWMWRNPWSFEVSDRELRRAGRLPASIESDRYLYIKLEGILSGGTLRVAGASLAEDSITLKKFGEDSWGKENYTAVKLKHWPGFGRKIGGQLTFQLSSPQSTLDRIRFLALTKNDEIGFDTFDLSSLFNCQPQAQSVVCTY